ncbi:MAG: hypothetical protein WD491_01840 [Balneolales bacterium]
MKIQNQPKEYNTVTPYLAIREAEKLIRLLEFIFDAERHKEMRDKNGVLIHAEIKIGDSILMIGDVQDKFEPFPAMLYIYCDEVDEIYRKALDSNAESIELPTDQDYGDRRCAFRDFAGNTWYVATQVHSRS